MAFKSIRMIFDNPTFLQNVNLPRDAIDGQTAFIEGIGLHQFVNGAWIVTGGNTNGNTTTIPQPISQHSISTVDTLLYQAKAAITVKELTLVTADAPVEITVYLMRQGTKHNILDRAWFDGYLTTIASVSIPLIDGDALYASATNGPSFNITLSGAVTTNESLVVAANVTVGTSTVFTAQKPMTVCNLILCNAANITTETSVSIKRANSDETSSVFLNQVLTQAGEVVMADFAMAIDTGSTINVTTDHPISLLITAE